MRPNGDTAWGFVDDNMIQTGDRETSAGRSRRLRYRFSIVMARRDGRWRRTLFRGDSPKGQ